jgi:hypothetical protein
MSEGIVSARVLASPPQTEEAPSDDARPRIGRLRRPVSWRPETFAQEQIRGLVRQVFFPGVPRPVRQVVFSAVEETDLRNLCRAVGDALAAQTQEAVAVVGGYPRLLQRVESQPPERAERDADAMPLRQIAARVRGNLWLVPDGKSAGDRVRAASLHSYLADVRRQFEFSIVEAPTAATDEAIALAQFGDGIILVVSAHRTRRAAACQVKAALEGAGVRILGVVLSDRMFPIPEAVYRRL